MSTLPESTVEAPEPGTVDYRLEVVVLSVSDTDRAKAFYTALGWREDADFPIRDGFRVVQMTPPGSPASIIFGTGVTAPDRGPVENMVLATYDIEAARADLIARGVEVSDLFHSSGFDYNAEREYGPDGDRNSYSTFASFSDPDGNGWLLQEIKTRLPGR